MCEIKSHGKFLEESKRKKNQRTNGPVNAHLKPEPIQNLDKMAEKTLTLINTNPLLTHSVHNINLIPGHRMQQCPKNPSLSHFSM